MFLFALLSVQRFYFYFLARVSPSVHFQICTKWKCLLIAAFWRALRHFKGLHLYLTLLADRATDAIYLHDSLFLFVYVFVWWMWVYLRAILRNVFFFVSSYTLACTIRVISLNWFIVHIFVLPYLLAIALGLYISFRFFCLRCEKTVELRKASNLLTWVASNIVLLADWS